MNWRDVITWHMALLHDECLQQSTCAGLCEMSTLFLVSCWCWICECFFMPCLIIYRKNFTLPVANYSPMTYRNLPLDGSAGSTCEHVQKLPLGPWKIWYFSQHSKPSMQSWNFDNEKGEKPYVSCHCPKVLIESHQWLISENYQLSSARTICINCKEINKYIRMN